MTISTQCPQCQTRFKVTQAQLDAHQGLVRCGHCHAVFNAAERLQREGALPAPSGGNAPKPIPVPLDVPELTQGGETKAASKQTKFVVGCVLLVLLLLGQALYFWRIPLAAWQPGFKPALVAYCQLLHCDVPLPQETSQILVESSRLEADPMRPGEIHVEAVLRNQASHAEAWPHIELTLTDAQDKLLVRRAFTPQEYLPPGETEEYGFIGGHEITLHLDIDVADLKAVNYTVVPVYPQ